MGFAGVSLATGCLMFSETMQFNSSSQNIRTQGFLQCLYIFGFVRINLFDLFLRSIFYFWIYGYPYIFFVSVQSCFSIFEQEILGMVSRYLWNSVVNWKKQGSTMLVIDDWLFIECNQEPLQLNWDGQIHIVNGNGLGQAKPIQLCMLYDLPRFSQKFGSPYWLLTLTLNWLLTFKEQLELFLVKV